jgi:hypothetical protein
MVIVIGLLVLVFLSAGKSVGRGGRTDKAEQIKEDKDKSTKKKDKKTKTMVLHPV